MVESPVSSVVVLTLGTVDTHALGTADTSALGPFSTGSLAVMLLIVVATALILIRTRRKIRAAQLRSGPGVREQYQRLSEEQTHRRDLDETILQLDQLARQVGAMIDTKYAKLEAVVRDADRRIEQLSKLTRARQGSAGLDVTIGAEEPAGSAAEEVNDVQRAAVYRLADEGKSALEIAQALSQPAGEVELILALRRTRARATPSPLSSA